MSKHKVATIAPGKRRATQADRRGQLAKFLTAAAVAAAAGTAATPTGRRALRRIGREADRKSRYLAGKAEGLRYRLRNGGPDPNVPDLVLADRLRSTLGPLERELDIPRVHVMVVDKVALLHGDVDTAEHAERIEEAVERVPGVDAVQSYLHVGLSAG